MANRPKKKSIEKKEFNIESLKEGIGLVQDKVKDKETSWLPFSPAFHEALGIPGAPRGYVTQFRGFSDTGKSTGVYEAIVAAQKIGDFPVIIDTEGSFSWEHAKTIGMKYEEVVDEETGEIINYKGDFLFFSGLDLLNMFRNFDYSDGKEKTKSLRGIPVIEDVARIMNLILDKQDAGELNRNVVFTWDSIGSIDCFKGAMSSSSNNMWNAGALNSAFQSILNFRIPASRREGTEFINTMVCVNKVWLDSMGGAQPTVKQKGGEGFRYGSRLIVHMGGKLGSSSKKLNATSGGDIYNFGVECRIEVFKNQVNGIEKKGKICSTSHGFINPDKLNDYKKEHKDFILSKLNTDLDDFTIDKEDIGPSNEDFIS
jgi:hypothetical protein